MLQDLMLDLRALSAKDAQMFFVPYNVAPSPFIATIGGFTITLDDLFPDELVDAEDMVIKAIRDTICGDLAFTNIIANRSTAPITPQAFARNIVAVGHVEELPKAKGEPRSAPPRLATRFNVYFRNPPLLQKEGFYAFAKQFHDTLEWVNPDNDDERESSRGRGRKENGSGSRGRGGCRY
ncbi:hypothetical protein H0H92_013123 [Tricholoma furcatifolium]|nr:hypothetical protein H0H92_013123 [Tricholoma furcatifolium]